MTQVWGTNARGGYMYSDELSSRLRTAVQPLCRFRQFCDAKLAKGLNRGDTYAWNVYSDVADAGARLTENVAISETQFTITQATAKVREYGNAVPYTSLLDDLSLQPVTEIINKVLKNDASKVLDNEAFTQFNQTLLRARGTGSGSSAALEVVTDGTGGSGPNVAMENDHVKLVADELSERNIPAYDGQNYICLARPRALRKLKNDLETIHQYTSEGWYVIMNGEKGRYEGIRFIEQTNIARVMAAASASTTAAELALKAWVTGQTLTGARDRAFFFGNDTVAEAVSIPEEIRGKIPTDFGRDLAVAWYALLGFSIIHNATGAAQNRILCWDSQHAT